MAGMGRRKIAANKLVFGRDTILQAIVELENGVVTKFYPFDGEEENTEWLGGTIRLSRVDGILKAFKDGINIVDIKD